MKKIILLLGSLLVFSCKEHNVKNKKTIETKIESNSESIYLDKNALIFISPSSEKLQRLKKKMGEDFYTIADDANYYYSNAIHFLDSLQIKYINEKETKRFSYRDIEGNIIQIGDVNKNWYALSFDNDKKEYRIIDLVTFSDDYKKIYFVKNSERVKIEDYSLSKIAKYTIIKKLNCDLNADELEDAIIVFKNNKEFDSNDEFSKKSLVVVFFGSGNNEYRKVENSLIFSNDSNDFFKNIVIKNNFFTVELNNEVPDKYLMKKYITFRYNKFDDSLTLFKYGQVFSGDRNDTLLYTSKNFGKINFEEYDSNEILNKIRSN